jgi:hypothetical protein
MSQSSPDRESLQTLLVRVQERLREAGSVEVGSRELLRQVMSDIEKALQDSPAPHSGLNVPAVAAAAEAHTPRLEALAVQFEADHPALADVLRRLVDLLGKAGI